MLIDRIMYPVESLGPGKRLAIWTVGCGKHCYKCANQELWEFDKNKEISVKDIVVFIDRHFSDIGFDGITVTGGDPFEQKEDLLDLLEELRNYCDDILVYTGFTYDELEAILTPEEKLMMNKTVDVLIDGRYVDALNDNKCSLRGSVNQKIYFLNKHVRERYRKYMMKNRKIQNIYYKNRLISVGIHNKEI